MALPQTLESYNDVFADIVNVLLFNGKRVITEDSLTEAKKTTGGVKMCDVIQAIKTEGRVEGRIEGRIEGEKTATDKILSLFAKLYALGKGDDVQKATKDREYLKKLMEEYQK